MSLTLTALLIAGFTFLLAGAVKGVIGLGLPTVAIGLLVLVMTPAEAAALLVIPSLVTNLWQLAAGPRFGALLHRLWPMLLGICLGTLAGAGVITGANAALATGGLGAALILYSGLALTGLRPAVPKRLEAWLSPLVGGLTGLVTGATGVFVIPAVPYLQALNLEKNELIQALGLSFTVSTLALAVALAHHGAFDLSRMAVSLLALLPALLGMLAGQWIRERLSLSVFRLCFLVGLLALGMHLLLQSW